jgi:hypothetical protein
LRDCYANPQSASHRPFIVKLRLAKIKKKGIAIPDCMKGIADDPAWQLKAKDGIAMREGQGGQPEAGPVASGGAPEASGGGSPGQISAALVAQLDANFQALMGACSGDANMAFREACLANLGFAVG